VLKIAANLLHGGKHDVDRVEQIVLPNNVMLTVIDCNVIRFLYYFALNKLILLLECIQYK